MLSGFSFATRERSDANARAAATLERCPWWHSCLNKRTAIQSMPAKSQMPNPRSLLKGTWKSDRRLTLKGCHRYHELSGVKKRRFAGLFGRLILRYSPRRVHFVLRGMKWSARYEIVAGDSDSLVIRVYADDLWKQADPIVADLVREMSEPRLVHLQFRIRRGRPYYFIGLGSFCEWFRRETRLPR